ncbi:MAG: PEP/pyruvate-binding domain-containing protein [Bacteroidia bacterium]
MIQNSKTVSLTPDQHGAKALGLGYLQDKGFRVPPFFVLDYDTLVAVLEEQQELESIVRQWRENNNISADSLWAVRSSAAVEDGKDKSFAGLFNTQINVAPDDLAAAINTVLQAFADVRQLKYETEGDFSFGIIIQSMLRPDYAGVVFSHNPLDPAQEVAMLNLVPGLGEALVSGRAEAFMVQKAKQAAPEFLNAEDEFRGEVFGPASSVLRSGTAIKKAVEPLLEEIFAGTEKLSQLKEMPVDIELAIAEDQVYWLQIRPITSQPKAKVIRIWDNANIGENYPGLTMPLTITFARHTYEEGYSSMKDFLGMPKASMDVSRKLLANMVGPIDGALYYNVTAWQQLLYQLPFGSKSSQWIIKGWNMDPADFEKPKVRPGVFAYIKLLYNLISAFINFNKHRSRFEDVFMKGIKEYDIKALAGQSHAKLTQEYGKFEAQIGDNWLGPMLNGFYTLILFSSLKRMVKTSRLAEEYPNFVNDILFSQGDVVSVQIVKNFQALCDEARADVSLKALFLEEASPKVLAVLTQDHSDFYAKIETYIEAFGERAAEGELKMETLNYKNDPASFIDFMRTNIAVDYEKKHSLFTFDYREVLKKAYARNPLKRWVLTKWVQATLPRIRDRENYRFMRTKSFHVARSIFGAIGVDLHKQGLIDHERDYLYLEYDEILDLSLASSYRSLVAERKTQYQEYAKVKHAHRYIETEEGIEAVQKMADVNAKGHLKGTGCCSGIVQGPVVIIEGPDLKEEIPGAIFVAHHFEPGWINLFAKASGVISERGNLLSHTAILCREMGIPSVVGVKGLMDKVKAGDHIQMNGATGEINLIADEE